MMKWYRAWQLAGCLKCKGGSNHDKKIFCRIRQSVTNNSKGNPLGIAWNIKGRTCTGKNLPSYVWTGSQIIPGICQSRNTIKSRERR